MKDFIIQLAKDAGKLSLDYIGKIHISSKGEKDIVTEADKDVEKLIISRIKEKFPDHNIVSEETDNRITDSDYCWYIDPIDGTANFAHGDPNYCISIALTQKGELEYGCIFIPITNELYFAQKGKGAMLNGKNIRVSKIDKIENALVQLGVSPLKHTIDESLRLFKYATLTCERARDYGFCAGQLAYTAAGRADIFVKMSQHAWDLAAGVLLVTEAGGKVTDWSGKKITLGDKKSKLNIVATNNILHETVLAHLKKSEIKEAKQNNEHWF
jgi:myo-inositol-1(or 4)-monophosphatase